MRKIIGFRIELRAHEIARRAKKAGLVPSDAGSLEVLAAAAVKAATAAVLFETFPPTDPDSPQLSSMPGLAYSLILATLGPGFEAARQAAEQKSPAVAPWWGLMQEMALDEIFRFASALIADEAAKESCELSPLSKLSDAAALEKAVGKIDAGKIGVGLSESRLAPAPPSAASLSWLAKTTAKSRK